jgi:hypothetical protein
MPLATPAEAYGCLLAAQATPRGDATAALAADLARVAPARVAQEVQVWLGGPAPRRAAYSIGVEVWGDTALHRRALGELAQAALERAFPRWEYVSSGGVRLLCKADTRAAFVGVQLYSNVAHDTPPDKGRHGALREHLACGLLALAGVVSGDVVLDPFMGTGSILAAAARLGAEGCIGAEPDGQAYRLARRRVRAPVTRLLHGSFEELDVAALPGGLRLVSNLPFGVQFAPVPSARLLRFLERLEPQVSGAALLMARRQAAEIAPALGLRVKHVLVLGQPAAIAYS